MEPIITTSLETISRWLAEPEAAQKIYVCIRALERRGDDQGQEILRLRHQVRILKTELGSTRHLLSVAERQLEGVDEDSFDPTKQKGIGAIPIGGDFSQIEAIERMWGMGPTLDALGLGSAEHTKRLGQGAEAEEAIAIIQAGHAIPRAALGRILQVLWAARCGLREILTTLLPEPRQSMNAIVAAIDSLVPRAAFAHHLDIEDWHIIGSEPPFLPPLREP